MTGALRALATLGCIPRRGSACPGQHNIKKKPNARKCVDLFTATDGPARYAKPPQGGPQRREARGPLRGSTAQSPDTRCMNVHKW